MATTKSASGTSPNHSTAEMREWFANDSSFRTLRDVAKPARQSIPSIDKETLKGYFKNIGSNEVNLRRVSRYLYYRSNIYFRLINWYADMWDLRCRKVVPEYSLTKNVNDSRILKSFENTLDVLDKMNLHGNMTEVLLNVYIQDVFYGITYLDDYGMFFYPLDPDECIIDSRYSTQDFGFSVDMSKWRNAQRQQIMEYMGSPLKEMYAEYQRTGKKYVHCPDEYAACFKFRTDTWDTVIPPFVGLFLQLANLEDLVDVQAEADALELYKLIYMPLETISGSKSPDDWAINPAFAQGYFNKLVENGIPEGVAAAIVPGKELKVINFERSVDSDTTSVEKASNQVLQTAGGGAVINANNITSTAAFNAWLRAETEFAISTLMPQINGFTNRILSYKLNNAAKVEHFEVSVYTKEEFAESLLKSAQYSFPNRLAYNTCLGISEKETLAMLYLENTILGLPDSMRFPLSSSFTSTGNDDYTSEIGQGAPRKKDTELSPSGEKERNR